MKIVACPWARRQANPRPGRFDPKAVCAAAADADGYERGEAPPLPKTPQEPNPKKGHGCGLSHGTPVQARSHRFMNLATGSVRMRTCGSSFMPWSMGDRRPGDRRTKGATCRSLPNGYLSITPKTFPQAGGGRRRTGRMPTPSPFPLTSSPLPPTGDSVAPGAPAVRAVPG